MSLESCAKAGGCSSGKKRPGKGSCGRKRRSLEKKGAIARLELNAEPWARPGGARRSAGQRRLECASSSEKAPGLPLKQTQRTVKL